MEKVWAEEQRSLQSMGEGRGGGGAGALHEEHQGNHGQADHPENPVHVNEGQHGGLALQFAIQDPLGLLRGHGHAGPSDVQHGSEAVSAAR